MIRTRFAPSPTGIPHIGSTRTALFAFLLAKANKGEFLLRVEDTDQKRLVKGSEESIDEILKWLGLFPDKKFKQSERIEIYKKHVKELIKTKKAYEKDGAVYVHLPEDREFSWIDAVGNKKISFKGKEVEDFVVLKSDGFPTYHLASVVDDHLMEISHVMRGEEWISSTPKHLYLYELFGWKHPIFVHLPVILGNDHTKLSKRHGAKSALDYRDEGYLPEAINNYTALLGWNPGGEEEILTMEDMISKFKIEDINTANPVFDLQKLNWMNGVWIRKLSAEKLKERLLEFYANDKEVLGVLENNPRTEKLFIGLAQTRMKTLPDFKELVVKTIPNVDDERKKLAEKLIEAYKPISNWEAKNISNASLATRDQLNMGTADIYTVLTGKSSGLPFDQRAEAEGKATVIDWLKKIVSEK